MEENHAGQVQPLLSTEETLSLSVDELFGRLTTSLSGLTSEEAEKRLALYGRNELARGHEHSAIREFLMHFKSPLVIILLVAAIISGILGEVAHFVIIFAMPGIVPSKVEGQNGELATLNQ